MQLGGIVGFYGRIRDRGSGIGDRLDRGRVVSVNQITAAYKINYGITSGSGIHDSSGFELGYLPFTAEFTNDVSALDLHSHRE